MKPAREAPIRWGADQHHQPAEWMARGWLQSIVTFMPLSLTRAALGASGETRKEDVEVHPNARMNRTYPNAAVTAPVRRFVQRSLNRNAMAADQLVSAFRAVGHIHKLRHRPYRVNRDRQVVFTLRQS